MCRESETRVSQYSVVAMLVNLQKDLLGKAQAELKPLKEQLSKQGIRVNSLNASLHDKEKQVKNMTEENEELVSDLDVNDG